MIHNLTKVTVHVSKCSIALMHCDHFSPRCTKCFIWCIASSRLCIHSLSYANPTGLVHSQTMLVSDLPALHCALVHHDDTCCQDQCRPCRVKELSHQSISTLTSVKSQLFEEVFGNSSYTNSFQNHVPLEVYPRDCASCYI